MSITAWILLSCLGLTFGQNSFVFLGPGEGSLQPEVVSLPLGDSPVCELQLQPYPLEWVEGAFTFLLPGAGITVCGGGYSTCLSLHPFLGTWEEIISPLPYNVAGGAKAISLQNSDILILGAYEGEERTISSTLIYSQETGEWVEGPQMPDIMYGFCAVQLNSTHTLMMGGSGWNDDDDMSELYADVFMFDGTTFQKVSSLLEPRYEMGCTLNQEGHVVVAGGMGPVVEGGDPDGEPMDSVEIYNPLEDIWTPGPPLPKAMGYFSGMVADGEKLLLLGGATPMGDYTNDIHSLVPGAEAWVLEETHLAEANGYLQAIKVTSDSLDC